MLEDMNFSHHITFICFNLQCTLLLFIQTHGEIIYFLIPRHEIKKNALRSHDYNWDIAYRHKVLLLIHNNNNNNNLYSYIALHHMVNALSALHVGIHLGFKASQSTQAQPMCHSHLWRARGANHRPSAVLQEGGRRDTYCATREDNEWIMNGMKGGFNAHW